jgi:hypothetical protein
MMNRTLKTMAGLMAIAALSAPVHALEKYNMLMGGYYDGPSVSGTVGLGDIFEKFPVGFEIGLGYSWASKGDAILARKVFINQATGGNDEAQSSGGVLDVGINGTVPLNKSYGPIKFVAFGGPRYSRWAVRHQYVGGNEDFDVVAHSWGLGGGIRGVRPLSEHFNAVMQLELNYYFPTSIYGHDATYYPDNHNINARDDNAGYTYTYDDATNSTAVPRLRPRVMVGIQF